ncbi:hypothetical protein NQ176_g127 [Zarea fungicola]|uniref:Uncharacterized protein n=1 Tax=Zarea fungicola TaxID=93591 RepID=A0ACC1NYR2_9HYPO|nr:hypothetical protein NQ176_g127 [Lecanicillium fungicola]
MAFLVQTCHSESSEILSHICDLLLAQGYPAVDDIIFVPVVEFWSSFAEAVPDYLAAESSEEASWKATAFSFLLKASASAWQKITYPASEEVTSWDSNDRAGFTDSRKDVIDLLLSVYALVGPQLLGTFADTVVSSLRQSSWLRLEAAAYCLGGLADCCQDDDRCDDFLASVFNSELFSMLRNGRDIVPTPGDATTGTGVIVFYTREQRDGGSSVEVYLEAMLLVSGTPADGDRRLLARYEKIGRILEFIESDLDKCRHLQGAQSGNWTTMDQMTCPDSIPEENASLHMALKVLRCLVGVGKGVQAPAENAIDLEHENQPVQLESAILPDIQRRIVSIIVELQKMFPDSAEITEQICNVLRTGFSEREPGPFVLPSAEVAQYFASHTLSTPRVGLFISTACSFINSIGDKDNQNIIFSVVLGWVIGLLKQLPSDNNSYLAEVKVPQIDISAEPEVAQNAMEIASRMISREPTVLLQAQPSDMAEYFFLFTLQALDGNEPLPKAAAAEFWSTFVNMRSSEEGFQTVLSAAMATLGPLLCQSIARNIGGNASRSELDKLSDPLKKLFNRYSKAKDWLDAGLNHPSFPSSKVSQADKSMLVKKLSSLRGARATNQIVRDFWLAARGSTFSYTA